jgi:hypothetical protein
MPLALEPWDLALEPLAERSWFYALPPIALGTPFVESLSGYVVRLAEAHAVSAGSLVRKVLSSSEVRAISIWEMSHTRSTASARVRNGGSGHWGP